MQASTRAFWLTLGGLAVLWFLSDLSILSAANLMAPRGPAIHLTGVLAVGSMCAAVLLALRPRWPERIFGGLDKLYRLHRRFGIAALVFSVTHWILTQAPKWLSGLRLAERGATGSRPPDGAHRSSGGLEQFFFSQRHLAETLGEWAFYLTAALILIALLRQIPYRIFYQIHRLIAIVFLVLVFHSVVLFRFGNWVTPHWFSPVGMVLTVLLAGGVVGALVSLVGRIGAGRKAKGVVSGLHYYPELRVLRGDLEMGESWPGHQPGQFAFVDAGTWEGQHPFTIASAWNPAERKLTFFAKELGDFTSTLKKRARVGAEVTVEGPYGFFTFQDRCPIQIWIGAGIGITPFLARMQQLASELQCEWQVVHLFHPTAEYSDQAIGNLTAAALAAGVRLHVLHDARDGFLTGERVRAEVPQWRSASIWFCGPAAFGTAIRCDFEGQGFDRHRFHQELFAWR